MGVNYNTLAAFLKIKPPSRTNILHIDIRKRAIGAHLMSHQTIGST